MSESDLSEYESDCLKEEEEDIADEDNPIVVREIETEYQGWRYLQQSNSYIFQGIDALVEIINHYDGDVDVFVLHNSSIKREAFLAAQLHRIKNLSVYTPVKIFPVYPKG